MTSASRPPEPRSDSDESPSEPSRKASLAQVFGAVLWSFFGVATLLILVRVIISAAG